MSSQGLSVGRQVSLGVPSEAARTLPGLQTAVSTLKSSHQAGEGVFSPHSRIPEWLQRPQCSQRSDTRLHEAGVCFAGWAGSAGCLQKVFHKDKGWEANDPATSAHLPVPRHVSVHVPRVVAAR